MESHSKYHINGKGNSSKLIMKMKPSPVLFGSKNGVSPAKKMKLFENDTYGTVKKPVSFGAINGHSLKPKVNIQEHRKNLPIFEQKNKLIELIQKHPTLIILAETGSGKTTQIPQYISSANLMGYGMIAVTQPRRVAAISVAMRVAQEYGKGMTIGDYVGFSVRFEDVTSKKTVIKYVTDGMLLREAIGDRLLLNYTVVILDEAHERTIHTDILFGIVKTAQKVRAERHLKPLKIVVMSATMDVDHLSQFFDSCPVVCIEGRSYPVDIYYTTKPHDNYQTACVSTFFKIHKEAPPEHDVLIFLTGQEEIESCAHQIKVLSRDPEMEGPPVKVCPLYAALPCNQQMAVFQSAPVGTRKVIISTNIAETSVTISGIKYVIDGGMVKLRSYHPSTGMEVLKVQKISKEQAWQRSGRAGRVSEGYCYRLYTRTQFETMKQSSEPEIQHANLNSVALLLLSLGIEMLNFDFLDKPPTESVKAALEQLKLLGAIDDVNSIKLTVLGTKMSKFPLDPRFSKILLSAESFGCLEEALSVVAILSSDSICLNPASKREEALNARQKFKSPYGDLISLLNLYREFENIGHNNRKVWCTEHFMNLRNLLYAREVRLQLHDICKKLDMRVSSCGSQMDQLRKCLLSGLFMNVAELHRDRQYLTVDKKQAAMIHPSSNMHGQQPHYVIFTEVVQTTKCYLRQLTTIDGQWLSEIAPEYLQTHSLKFQHDS